jgi:hypothetical protein
VMRGLKTPLEGVTMRIADAFCARRPLAPCVRRGR